VVLVSGKESCVHTAPNKACSRPPSARVGVRSNPCKRRGLQRSHPLQPAAANANRWALSRGKTIEQVSLLMINQPHSKRVFQENHHVFICLVFYPSTLLL